MRHLRLFPPFAPLVLAVLLPAPAFGQDAVIFPDGFTLKGKAGKEEVNALYMESLFSTSSPFDYLNSGPKFVFFSNNAKKGIQLVKGVKEEKELEFKRAPGRGLTRLPKVVSGHTLEVSEYNADGRRTITVKNPGFPEERIVQVASYMSPKYVYLSSITHKLRQVYATPEVGAEVVRGLLANHPDLTDGWLPVPDPMKRMTVAEFLLQAGWRNEAREELAKLKKDAPWAWPKEATTRFDELSAEIDRVEATWILDELDLAVQAGQYTLAETVLGQFRPRGTDKAILDRLSKLKATVETLQPRYYDARRQLQALRDELTGADKLHAASAVGGAPIELAFPAQPVAVAVQPLVEAANAVLTELHPDTLERIETFTQIADQMDRTRAAGREPRSTAEQALALAVTGWLLGKNGAKNDPAYAMKVWNTRKMVIAYLRDPVLNDRTGILKKYQQSADVLGADEIAQIVSLLPPIAPEDPAAIDGREVPVKECGAPNVYEIKSGPLPDDTTGVNYFIRLPREYRHGRAYPVVVAIHEPGVDPAKMIGLLATECERHGYILIAPEWAPPFGGKHFDYAGGDHRIITSAIRDLSRKFTVDQDRVFAFGYGEGGTFALDLAMSRPDHFAGVVSMGAVPVHQFYRDYAKNAQKVAVYSVTGELSQASLTGLRELYQNWLPYGFYAILSVYKGRGAEWFSEEVPTIFEWMNTKKRVRGLESLRMDGKRFDAWHTFRPTDDRFYWVGARELVKGNTLQRPDRPDIPPPAAKFSADIVDGNKIVVKGVYGVKKITVWLERGMVAWGTKVRFIVDSGTGLVPPVVVTPDVQLMLEELYRTGDRKMLFFAKFEFKVN